MKPSRIILCLEVRKSRSFSFIIIFLCDLWRFFFSFSFLYLLLSNRNNFPTDTFDPALYLHPLRIKVELEVISVSVIKGLEKRLSKLEIRERIKTIRTHRVSWYDTELSDGEVPVLELRGMSNTITLPLLSGQLWTGAVVPVSVTSMIQIKWFTHLQHLKLCPNKWLILTWIISIT